MPYRTEAQIYEDLGKIEVISNPQVKLSLTADDWQLYDGTGYEGRDRVAEALNCDIAKVINDTDGQKMDRCANVLGKWSHYGAADTEGYDMLDTILNAVFGGRGRHD